MMHLRLIVVLLLLVLGNNAHAQCISGDCNNGLGTMQWYGDISLYTGSWRNGKMNGSGVMTYADGSIFKGNWVNGRLHGKGEMAFAGKNRNGTLFRDTIKGFWYNDSVYPNGFTKGKQQASLFVMKKGNIDSGFGKIYWLNGNRYQGEIKKGQMHGKGKLTISKNGDLPVFDILGECVYEGEFSKGYMQGSGKITRDGILEKEGQFEMNVYLGDD
jgi:hypothetical protein